MPVSGLSGCCGFLLSPYVVLCSSPLSITIITCNLLFPFQIECMVAAEIMQRYKKLQFERGRWPAVESALTPTTGSG